MAYERDGLQRLPKIPRRLIEPKARLNCISQEDEKKILAYCLKWEYYEAAIAITVLMDTGMRLGELEALERIHVKIESRSLTIYGKPIYGTKNGEFRTVPLTTRATQALERQMNEIEGDLLFPDIRKTLRPTWEKVRVYLERQTDKDFVLHSLRHACATRLIQKRVSLPMVQKWLGHRDIKTTMKYLHISDEMLTEARDALER